MNDEPTDEIVRNAARSDDAISRWDVTGGEDDLLQAILAGDAEGAGGSAPARPRRRFLGLPLSPLRAGLALACVAGLVVVAFALTSGGAGTGSTSFADAAVRVAEANPRYLVTEPGWSVTRVDEFEADSGEIEFGDGDGHGLQITWYPARYYGSYYRDRGEVAETDFSFPELGASRTVSYSDTDFATMLEPDGAVFVEIRGDRLSETAYKAVLGSLEQVDVDAWLDAMPESVVKPDERADAVDEIVADMPIPPGVNLEALKSDAGALERYQLVAETTSAVACGWLDQWAAAYKGGDAAAEAEATAALQSSHQWAALKEIQHQGGYSAVVWEIADWVKNDQREYLLGTGVSSGNPDGRVYGYGPRYATALGCDSEHKHVIEESGAK